MPTIKLHKIPKAEEAQRVPGLVFKKGVKMNGEGDYTFACGSCDTVLAENMVYRQLGEGLPMFCPDCQTWSKVPPYSF